MSTTPVLWRTQSQVNTADAAVAPGGTNVQSDGQVIAVANGGYVVTWTDESRTHNSQGTGIVGQLYDADGNPVGGEVELGIGVGGQSWPALTALPNGDILVVSVDTSAGVSDIYARRFTSDLASNGFDSVDGTPSHARFPAITALPDGTAVVAYQIGSGGDTDIVARIVSPGPPGQQWGIGDQFTIHDENDNSGNVELATLSNGNFVAVYQDENLGDALDRQIEYRIFTATGTPLGLSHTVIGGGGPTAEWDPDVAALRDGGFVVVWTEDADVGGQGIRATLHDNNGTAIAANVPVTTSQAGNQNEASVVALADGGFLVTWEDDFADVVRAQRFDASASMVGTEFTVHNGVATDSPEAAVLNDGRIAFAHGDESTGDTDVWTSIWDPRPPQGPTGVVWQHVEGSPALANQVLGDVGSAWQIRGTGDFDADGDSDILWRHVDGQVVTWEMEGAALVTNHNLGSVGNSWQLRATGDFDNDGDADIVWHHTDGQVVNWEMQNGNLVTNHNLASVANTWRIIGTGDFDADGDADMLWRHTDGQVVTWEMEGGSLVANHNLGDVPNSWQIRGTGDFDSDGDADILWHHDDGMVVTWEMEGGSYVTNHNLPDVGNGWRITGAADFDSDGDADILWRHDDGTVVTWEMETGAYVANHNFGLIPNGWQIRATGEFDLVG